MDMYWAYLIQRDLLVKKQTDTQSEDKNKKIIIKKDVIFQCGKCGQNRYWCQCNKTYETKVDTPK
jgi:hypothetical protein